LIEREVDALCAVNEPTKAQLCAAVLCATGLKAGLSEHSGFTLWNRLSQDVDLGSHQLHYSIVGKDVIEIEFNGDLLKVERSVDGWRYEGKALPNAAQSDDLLTVFGPDPMQFDLPDPFAQISDSFGGDSIRAPMPGLVKEVSVKVGDKLEEGDRLVVLEAMKMEHVLKAPRDGVVATVEVTSNAQVAAGDLLIGLEPEA